MKSIKKVKVIGYHRVSTPKQIKKCAIYCRTATEDNRRSNSIQGAKCLYEAKRDNCKVVKIIEDTASGMNLKRKGIQKLIKLVKGGEIDAIYATDLSRLSRNIGDSKFLIELFKEYEVELKLISKEVEGTAVSKLADRMVTIFTEYEKNLRAEKRLKKIIKPI